MMRLLAMLVLGAASMPLVMPMLAIAQSESSQTSAQTKAAQDFRAYLARDWKRWMEQYPETATSVGFPGQNRR
jgi:hypothetical protein